MKNFSILMMISDRILRIIKELKNLELKNQKDSEKYKNKVKELQKSLVLEDILYTKIATSPTQIDNLLHEMDEYPDIYSLSTELKEILLNKDVDLVRRRIVLHLYKHKQLIEKEQDPNYDENIFNNLYNVREEVKKDFIKTLLVLVDSYLNDNQFKKLRKIFLNMKYYICYLYDYIEQDFLDNNFFIDSKVNWNSYQIAVDNNVEQMEVSLYQQSFSMEMWEEIINPIINYNQKLEDFLKDYDNEEKLILMQLFIRASLLFYGEEKVEKIKQVFKNLNSNDFTNTMLFTFNFYEHDRNNIIIDGLNLE